MWIFGFACFCFGFYFGVKSLRDIILSFSFSQKKGKRQLVGKIGGSGIISGIIAYFATACGLAIMSEFPNNFESSSSAEKLIYFLVSTVIILIYFLINRNHTEYYSNGKVKLKGKTKYGKRNGKFNFFDKKGNIKEIQIYWRGDLLYRHFINIENGKIWKKVINPSEETNNEEIYFSNAPKSMFESNREFLIKALNKDGLFLSRASEKFKNDKEIVLTAVNQNGFALQFASMELKKDAQIVSGAIERDTGDTFFKQIHGNQDAFQFASDELRNDREFILSNVQFTSILKYASVELQNDKEFVVETIEKGGVFIPDLFINDKEVIHKAVKRKGLLIEYASEDLKKNREIVLDAVKNNGSALKYASEDIKTDREIVSEAIKSYYDAFQFASEELQEDPEIIKIYESVMNKKK